MLSFPDIGYPCVVSLTWYFGCVSVTNSEHEVVKGRPYVDDIPILGPSHMDKGKGRLREEEEEEDGERSQEAGGGDFMTVARQYVACHDASRA